MEIVCKRGGWFGMTVKACEGGEKKLMVIKASFPGKVMLNGCSGHTLNGLWP